MRIKNLKIGTRLAVAFSFLVIFTLTAITIAIIAIKRNTDITNTIYNESLQVIKHDKEIEKNLIRGNDMLYKLSNKTEEKRRNAILKKLDEFEFLIHQNIEILFEKDQKHYDDLYSIEASFFEWEKIKNEIILDVQQNKYEQARDKINKSLKNITEKILIQTKNLLKKSEEHTKILIHDTNEQKRKIEQLLILILILTAIFGITVSIVITRSLSSPLKVIVNGIKEIAHGNLNKTIKIDQKDEIGALAQSYYMMQQNLLSKAEIAKKIAAGEFDQRVKIMGNQDVLGTSINMIISNFEKVIEHAGFIANGYYEKTFEAQSDRDELGKAILKMQTKLQYVVKHARRIASGDYFLEINTDNQDQLSQALFEMTLALNESKKANELQNWLKSGQNKLLELTQGISDIDTLLETILGFIGDYLSINAATFYLYQEENKQFTLSKTYIIDERRVPKTINIGEGMPGQAVKDKAIKIFHTEKSNAYIINTASAEIHLNHILIYPFFFENKPIAFIEMGSVKKFDNKISAFLNLINDNIAINIISSQSRKKLEELLSQTKQQAEELKTQKEEMRIANQELTQVAIELQDSEKKLKTQQEELQVTNEELEEKTTYLEKQRSQITQKNIKLQIAQDQLKLKAKELSLANKYKSEFLSNISHELRTPLNSILILASSLVDNYEKNLSHDQIESARIIHKSGNDLLLLINDILDLSKIEAGKMPVSFSEVSVKSVSDNIQNLFKSQASKKDLSFSISIEDNVPNQIETDQQRLEQVIKNLVSNAIKFTDQGSISISIRTLPDNHPSIPQINNPLKTEVLNINVSDTGIGIPEDQQKNIFEAFRQVDGGISRKYGGTGLGLSISKSLINKMNGDITLKSIVGQGSVFSIFLPVKSATEDNQIRDNSTHHDIRIIEMSPNLTKEKSSQPTFMFVQNDSTNIEIIKKVCLTSAVQYFIAPPDTEINYLCQMYGVSAMIINHDHVQKEYPEFYTEQLKDDLAEDLYIHIFSTNKDTIPDIPSAIIHTYQTNSELTYLFKQIITLPSQKKLSILAFVESKNLQEEINKLLKKQKTIASSFVNSDTEYEYQLQKKSFNLILFQANKNNIAYAINILERLQQIKENPPSFIVLFEEELEKTYMDQLNRLHAQAVKLEASHLPKSFSNQINQAMFLNVHTTLNETSDISIPLEDENSILSNKTVLIVDDDQRNVFAVSKLLKEKKIKTYHAANGKEAIEFLDNNQDIHLIFMDIMMPVMDGFQAISLIKANEKTKNIPIIALTAKAMKTDKEKCINAGANDYLSKPIKTEMLYSMLKIWLYQ